MVDYDYCLEQHENDTSLPDHVIILYAEIEDLKPLPEAQKISLIIVSILLTFISVSGNTAAFFFVLRRKQRMLYKCCLLSLALGDLILGLTYTASLTPKFFQKYSNTWILGEAMCAFIPFVMTSCLLANSMTVTVIAFDRYQAVKSATKTRWQPNLWISLIFMLVIWALAGGTAVPMFSVYDHVGPLMVLFDDCSISPDELYFCTAKEKYFSNYYFVAVFTLIFLPLFVTFVGFYAVVAKYIWNQRLPLDKRQDAQISSTTPNPNSIKSDDTKARLFKKANAKKTMGRNDNSNMGTRSTLITDSGSATPINKRKETESETSTAGSTNPLPTRTVHTKRKIRTFKVILVLIITCFICRLPRWSLYVAETNPNVRFDAMKWFLLQYWFQLLSHASTALNPFLYSFLNETLNYIQIIRIWSRNFWGNYIVSNTVHIDNEKAKEDVVEEAKHINRIPTIVPRGPYVNNEDNRASTNIAVSIEVNHI